MMPVSLPARLSRSAQAPVTQDLPAAVGWPDVGPGGCARVCRPVLQQRRPGGCGLWAEQAGKLVDRGTDQSVLRKSRARPGRHTDKAEQGRAP